MKLTIPADDYLKQILHLAVPMVVVQLVDAGVVFIAMMMLATLSPDVLSASALIFAIRTALLSLSISLLFSLGIVIGHAYAEKDFLRVGCILQYGWFLSFFLSVPISIIFCNIYSLLIFFGQDPVIARIAEAFFSANVWMVPFVFFACASQQFFFGIKKQKISILATVVCLIVFLLSAYMLIFGRFGAPELGVAGYGYASALEFLTYVIITSFCFLFMPEFKQYELFRIRIHRHWKVLIFIIKRGWPFSVQFGNEMVFFMAGIAFIGWFNVNALAAYQVIMQYQFIIVIPVFVISQAIGILIGRAYGGKDFSGVKKIVSLSLMITVVGSVMIGFILLYFSLELASLFFDVEKTANREITHLITNMFFMLAVTQFFDALRNVFTGALRGLLDARFPMIVSLISVWFFSAPLGYVLTFYFHLGALGLYFGYMGGIILAAVILYFRWTMITANYK